MNCTTPQLDCDLTPSQLELNDLIQTLAFADKAFVFLFFFVDGISCLCFILSVTSAFDCLCYITTERRLTLHGDDRKIGPIYTLNQRCPKLKHWLCSRHEWEVFIGEEGTIEPGNESHMEKRGTSWLSEKQCRSALWAEIVYSYFKGSMTRRWGRKQSRVSLNGDNCLSVMMEYLLISWQKHEPRLLGYTACSSRLVDAHLLDYWICCFCTRLSREQGVTDGNIHVPTGGCSGVGEVHGMRMHFRSLLHLQNVTEINTNQHICLLLLLAATQCN